MISSPIKMSLIKQLLSLTIILAVCQQPHHAANLDGSTSSRRLEITPAQVPVLFETRSNSDAVLTCRGVGDQPGLFSELKWSGPNRGDNFEELKKKHTVSPGESNTLELAFNNPTPDDSGLYFCTGTFQSSDRFNVSVQVKVINPLKFENCPDRQFIVQGESDQKVSCRVTGEIPKLKLMKDAKPIEGSDLRYKWDATEDALKILKPADQEDEGTYIVQATSDITGKRLTQRIKVEVHSMPSFVPQTPANFTGVDGQQAELKCDVAGRPKPLVYWIDPRLRRNLTSVGGYFVNPETGTLLISKVNKENDNGTFTCLARNDVGEKSKSIPMIIWERPMITKFENKTVEEGQEVIMECRATGYPRPTFSIRRQGLNQQPYTSDNITDISETTEGGGGTEIYVYRVKLEASQKHYGIHYCNASNAAGNGPEKINQLFVKFKPDLGATPQTQYIRLGKNISVTCLIRAFPAPIVTWYTESGQQIINAQSGFKTNPDGYTHFSQMMPPASTVGRYRCQARNELGVTEQLIDMRYKQKPGPVESQLMSTSPTTADVSLKVLTDGGDGIKAFKYRLEGITNDLHNPTFAYRKDIQNEVYINSISPNSIYTIRNLLPNYRYTMTVSAANELGYGDSTEISLETKMPTKPEVPIIIKPSFPSLSQIGYTSDYQNGYVLKWSPPDLDNGDPITKYLIKINRVAPEFPDRELDISEERFIEQSDERPLHARLGPLEINRYYKIQVQARNKYGDSDPATLMIFTNPDRPVMPDFAPEALTWLAAPPTPILFGILVLAIIAAIFIDLVFCFCYQMGVSYSIKNCCCPQKANSVISDKTYT